MRPKKSNKYGIVAYCQEHGCLGTIYSKGLCIKHYAAERRKAPGTKEYRKLESIRRRLKYKEKLKIVDKIYRENNREAVKLSQTRWRKRNPEKMKAKRAKDREYMKAYLKKYNAENKERLKEYKVKHRIKYAKINREKIKLKNKEYDQKHPEKARARSALRRAKKLKATPNWVNKKELQNIYTNCPPGHHVDHIVPLQGKNVSGLHVPWNLQYLTKTENLRKSNKFNG